MEPTQITSPEISTGGLSGLSSASLRFPLSGVIGRRKSIRRGGPQLADVIKGLKRVLKSLEAAESSRTAAFATIEQWTASMKDSTTRDLVTQINNIPGGHNTGEASVVARIRGIIHRLQELHREEQDKNNAQKELNSAEKAYYKACYKKHSVMEIQNLDRKFKSKQVEAREAEISYRSSVNSTLTQCLTVFYQQLFDSSECDREHAGKVLELLTAFVDTGTVILHNLTPAVATTEPAIDETAVEDDPVYPENEQPLNFVRQDSDVGDKQQDEEEASTYQRLASFVSGKKHTLRFEDLFGTKNKQGGIATSVLSERDVNKSNITVAEAEAVMVARHERAFDYPQSRASNNPFSQEYVYGSAADYHQAA